MEEFGPLSTLPLGLPQLFGQTGQQLPKSFSSLIQTQLDILPFIAAANCLELRANFIAVTATGQLDFPDLIVPETEAWLVRGAYYSVGNLAVGSVYMKGRLYASRRNSGSPYSDVFNSGELCDTKDLTTLDRTFMTTLNGPFLLYGNDRIGINVENLNGAPGLGRYAAFIYRFSI